MIGLRRALVFSTGERYFSILANFATLAAVSRILTPEEIGVSVVGMAIVGIAMAAREFSSGSYLIQRASLTREETRSAFGAMLLVTTTISLVLALTAPTIAEVYGDARLLPYLRLISVSLFLELVSVPIVALLRREMAFGRVALISTSATAVASVVAISLALLGFSYMSFAWAWLSSAIMAGVLALALGGRAWLFVPRFSGWRGMMTFGGYNGLICVLQKAFEAAPYLLLGRILSVDAAALYSRGAMLCQLPDKIVLGGAITVVLPAFSAAAREGHSLREPYLRAIALVTAIQWPALLVLAALAFPIVDVLLGSQWRSTVPLVQIIAVASLWSFCFELNYPVLVAVGAVRDVLARALIVFPISAAVICGASTFGLHAVAWSMMLIMPFQALVSLWFVCRRIGIGWRDIVAAIWRSSAVAVAAALAPSAVGLASTQRFEPGIAPAAFGGMIAVAVWFKALQALRHPLYAEVEAFLPVLSTRRRRSRPA